jgi:hypothetical protein
MVMRFDVDEEKQRGCQGVREGLNSILELVE